MRHSVVTLASVLFVLSVWLPPSVPAQINATAADDVCLPAADPCIVNEEVFVQAGAVLDFGPRTLRLEEGGVLDLGNAGATIRSGRIEVDVDATTVAIRAAAAGETDEVLQGLEAVRRCSVTPRACFRESDCDLGICDVRRCELEPSSACTQDSQCDRGPCTDLGACSLSPASACVTNADCLKGPCGAALTCRGQAPDVMFPAAEPPLPCSSNADCALGDCTLGDGSIDVRGAIALDLASAQGLRIRAASDIVLAGKTEISGKEGFVELVTDIGDVDVDGALHSSGERGAHFQVHAGANVTIDAPIEMNGHEAGGEVAIDADGDILVRSPMTANSIDERDEGGRVLALSRKNLRVEGGSEQQPLVLQAGFGAAPSPGAGDGQGGTVILDALQNLSIASNVHLRADGDFAFVALTSGNDVDFRGSIFGTSFGEVTYGAHASIGAGNDAFLRSGSSVDLSNEGSSSLSTFVLYAFREAEIDGTIRNAAPLNSYSINLAGVAIEACSVRIGANADVLNAAADTGNLIVARGRLSLEEGASWVSQYGSNVARVRTEGIPVTLAGTIDPAMQIEIHSNLEPCPNCESDCGLLDDGCYLGTCDEDTATCIAVLIDGTACDDADECTVSDQCTGEVCMGIRNVACGDCGNTTVEWGEGCDDGDTDFAFGDLCRSDCQRTRCGHPTGTTGALPTAADALFVLRTSVDLAECPLLLCDANVSGEIETSDALLVLRAAVGSVTLDCPDVQP